LYVGKYSTRLQMSQVNVFFITFISYTNFIDYKLSRFKKTNILVLSLVNVAVILDIHSPIRLHGVVLKFVEHRDNFTFTFSLSH
jgi:hypothetical protein